MTNKEILEAAVKRANANGYPHNLAYDNQMGWAYTWGDDGTHAAIATADLIYSHEFAKALWGDYEVMISDTVRQHMLVWQWHLQQMVVSENPMQYMGSTF